VINMVRQTALAIGVAVFVAIVGSPASPAARLSAFQHAWWVIVALSLAGLVPMLLLIEPRRRAARAQGVTPTR
jgi:hypothetical protein